MSDILDQLMDRQRNCEHKNIVKVDSEIIGCYYQCVDCDKLSAVDYYFKHYKGDKK